MFYDSRLFCDLGTVNVVEIESADGIVSNVSRGGMTIFGFAYYWEAMPMNIIYYRLNVWLTVGWIYST